MFLSFSCSTFFLPFYFPFSFSFIFPLFLPFPLFYSLFPFQFPFPFPYHFPFPFHLPFQIRMIFGWLKLLLDECFLLLSLSFAAALFSSHCPLHLSFSLTHSSISNLIWVFANAMPVVTDHVNGHCTSPTSQPCPTGRARVPGGPEGPRLARRGPGRPPFRKAQSAACMEVSLPVSSLTEGVCLFSSSFIPLILLPLYPLSPPLPHSSYACLTLIKGYKEEGMGFYCYVFWRCDFTGFSLILLFCFPLFWRYWWLLKPYHAI